MTSNLYPTLLLKDQRLRFMRAHQEAFAVESWYPLRLYEEFVSQINAEVVMEASCKIEGDLLLAARFLVFFLEESEYHLSQVLNFFRQVENRSEVQLDYNLFQTFLGKSFDFGKAKRLTAGLDLRQDLSDSSLKLHFRLEDYPEKVELALALAGEQNSVLRQFVPQVGFDFYFDGRTEIELYAEFRKEQLQQPEIQAWLRQTFSSFVLEPLEGSEIFHIGLSKANAEPVLYYQLKDKKNLLNYFTVNDTAQKVNVFYQQQSTLNYVWVGVAQPELEKTRIENIRLYYHKSFYIGDL